MLPKIFQTSEELINNISEVQRRQPVKTYKIDFKNNRIYSVFVDDREAIAQHIVKILKTVRDRYIIYSSKFGCEVEYILGRNYSEEHFRLEFERLVNEALMEYERFVKVTDINITRTDSDTVEAVISVEIDTSEIVTVEVTI